MSRVSDMLHTAFGRLRETAGKKVVFRVGGYGQPIELIALDDTGVTEALQIAGLEGAQRVLTIDRDEYEARVGDTVEVDGETFYVLRARNLSAWSTAVYLGKQPLLS